jgi:hypothetical protein
MRSQGARQEAIAMEETVVVIVLQGGLVQAICCAEPLPGLRFEIIDYDVEGADSDQVSPIPYVDGASADGCRRGAALSCPSDIDWSRFGQDT